MPDLHHIVQAIVTILAVINPVVCGSIFLTLTTKQTLAQRQRAAVKAALSVLTRPDGYRLAGYSAGRLTQGPMNAREVT
jgi:hypothetical protein